MKIEKLTRKLGVVLVLLSMITLAVFSVSELPVAADPGDVAWEEFPIPSADGRVLTDVHANLGPMARSIDGTLYAYDSSGTGATDLFKSVDGGRTWSATGANVPSPVVTIGCSRSEPDVVFFATAESIYRSTNAGWTFAELLTVPPGDAISCLEVFDSNTIVAGTSGSSADVYISRNNGTTWLNTGFTPAMLINHGAAIDNIVAVAISPNFLGDQAIVAMGIDSGAAMTCISIRVGDFAWGTIIADPAPLPYATEHGDIAMPSDFDHTNPVTCRFFFGVDDGVYRFEAPSIVPRVKIASVCSLDMVGTIASAAILGGTTNGSIIRSLDNGTTWLSVDKFPTGDACAYVVMADDFIATGQAWVLVNGLEGALSLSLDFGDTWNQISLVKTTIGYIHDLSFADDGTIFMVTTDTAYSNARSIWRQDGNWERVYCSTLPTFGYPSLVEVTPGYVTDNVVFAAHAADTGIWRSPDAGQRWRRVGSSPGPIGSWTVIDDTTLLVGDRVAPSVYISTNSGTTWETRGLAGCTGGIFSLSLEPGYDGVTANDILAGCGGAQVFLSTDGGATWSRIDTGGEMGLGSYVSVAFDADYASNGIVYATSYSNGKVFRYADGEWRQIDAQGQAAEFPVEKGHGIKSAPNGVLYVCDETAGVGMRRCLNPRDTMEGDDPYWEVASDTGPTATLTTQTFRGLWLASGSNRAWSIDLSTPAVYQYTDTLAASPALVEPEDSAIVPLGTTTLSWEALPGARDYQIQVNTSVDFDSATDVPVTYTAGSLSATVDTTDLGTTYYWRVRVANCGATDTIGNGAPVRSYWSETREFVTEGGLLRVSPDDGASDVSIRGAIVVAIATGDEDEELSIEIELTTDPAFITDVTTVRRSARGSVEYVWDTPLEYSTTYHLRVRYTTKAGTSDWVTRSFTTEGEPVPSPPEKPAPTPTEKPAPAPSVPPETPAAPETPSGMPSYVWWIVGGIGALVIGILARGILRTIYSPSKPKPKPKK